MDNKEQAEQTAREWEQGWEGSRVLSIRTYDENNPMPAPRNRKTTAPCILYWAPWFGERGGWLTWEEYYVKIPIHLLRTEEEAEQSRTAAGPSVAELEDAAERKRADMLAKSKATRERNLIAKKTGQSDSYGSGTEDVVQYRDGKPTFGQATPYRFKRKRVA